MIPSSAHSAATPPAGTGQPAKPGSPGLPPRRAALQGKALEVATQVLLVTLLPRLLGPAEFGWLTLALSIVTLGTVAISLGAPSAFARFLPAETPARRAGLARTMTLQLLPRRAAQLAIAGIIGAILVIAAPSHFRGFDTALVFIALVLEVASVLASQVALGIGRTWVWSFRIAIRSVVLLVAVPVLSRLFGPVGILDSLVLSSAAGLVFAGWTVLGLMRRAEPGVPVPEGVARYGMVTGAASLAGYLTYRGPVLAAGALAGSAVQTGFASLASSIATALVLAGSPSRSRSRWSIGAATAGTRWERCAGSVGGRRRR